MLIVFGFAVAALIALFLGKFAWNVAYRLGARRTRRQIPGNLIELRAEKDRLRAEYAILRAKAELDADEIRSRRVEQEAEVMRNRNRIGMLGDQLAARQADIVARDVEIESLRDQLAVVEADLAARTETIEILQARVNDLQQQLINAPVLTTPLPGTGLEPLPQPSHRFDTRQQAAPYQAVHTPAQAHVEERLSRRIRDLTSMTERFRSPAIDRPKMPEIQPNPVPRLPEASPDVRLDEALREVREITEQPGAVREVDHGESLQNGGIREPAAGPRLSQSVANVVSLAQRLRALKRDLTN
jgi:hypothetical protein